MYEYCVSPPSKRYNHLRRIDTIRNRYLFRALFDLFIYLFPSLLLINFQTRTITRRNKEIFPFSVLSFELTKKEKESKFLFPCIYIERIVE